MILEGFIKKHDSHWLAEIPILDAMTQARNLSQLKTMTKDLIRSLADEQDMALTVRFDGHSVEIECDAGAPVMALILRQQRAKHGMTIKEIAAKLGFKSLNSYAQYEQGKSEPSLSQMERMLSALCPGEKLRMKVG